MYRLPCGARTSFANLVHVSATLCFVPNHRASGTGECCRAAGLSVTSGGRTTSGTPHPAFLFTSLSFLGHLPASPHSREGHGLSYSCEMSPVPGSWKSPDGVSKQRCDAIARGSIREPVAWLCRVGRRCASRSDVVARKNDGWLHCSIRLTAGLTLLRIALRLVRSRLAFRLVVHD
jgi:hypothetical protein